MIIRGGSISLLDVVGKLLGGIVQEAGGMSKMFYLILSVALELAGDQSTK